MKRMNMKLLLILSALAISGEVIAQENVQRIEREDAIIVCRSKECGSINSIMTKEFVYNKLAALLKSNVNKQITFCEANPNTHLCLNDGISFGAIVGATEAEIYLPSARVLDAKMMNDLMTEKFILEYELNVGNTYPECHAALNNLTVLSMDEIFIETPGFECHFTSEGKTQVNASYNIDYIDFDYGIIGAKYAIGLSEESQGGSSGYALLHFEKQTSTENNCDCDCNQKMVPPCQCNKQNNQSKEIVDDKAKVAATTSIAETPQMASPTQSSVSDTQTQTAIETQEIETDVAMPDSTTAMLKEQVVTQYKVVPIEVIIRTQSSCISKEEQDQDVERIVIQNVPIITEEVVEEQQDSCKMNPTIPVIEEVEEDK